MDFLKFFSKKYDESTPKYRESPIFAVFGGKENPRKSGTENQKMGETLFQSPFFYLIRGFWSLKVHFLRYSMWPKSMDLLIWLISWMNNDPNATRRRPTLQNELINQFCKKCMVYFQFKGKLNQTLSFVFSLSFFTLLASFLSALWLFA